MLRTLQKFSQMSGLIMNYDKTNVAIGESDLLGSKEYELLLGSQDFQSFGSQFSTDTKQIVAINYGNKLDEIHKISRVWTRRQHTPLGKITIIETHAISKIAHLFITLPDPPDTFMHGLRVRAGWQNSQINQTVSRKVKPYEEGR